MNGTRLSLGAGIVLLAAALVGSGVHFFPAPPPDAPAPTAVDDGRVGSAATGSDQVGGEPEIARRSAPAVENAGVDAHGPVGSPDLSEWVRTKVFEDGTPLSSLDASSKRYPELVGYANEIKQFERELSRLVELELGGDRSRCVGEEVARELSQGGALVIELPIGNSRRFVLCNDDEREAVGVLREASLRILYSTEYQSGLLSDVESKFGVGAVEEMRVHEDGFGFDFVLDGGGGSSHRMNVPGLVR